RPSRAGRHGPDAARGAARDPLREFALRWVQSSVPAHHRPSPTPARPDLDTVDTSKEGPHAGLSVPAVGRGAMDVPADQSAPAVAQRIPSGTVRRARRRGPTGGAPADRRSTTL